MKLQMYQVDAFTSKPFGGNPAAIVPLESWLPTETMQSIALENNLSETAFFVKEADGYGLRWFTPTFEIDLCGHATVASAHVLFEIIGETADVLRFQSKSGLLTVGRDGNRFVLDFPARPGTSADLPDGLVEAIGKEPKEVLRSRDYMLVYETEAEVAAIRPNFSALAEIDTHAVIVTASGDNCDFVSRFFAPEAGINEDPVTGSAHCTLIPYWGERLGKTDMFARQISARGGEIYCGLRGDRVRIGGNATLFMKGEIYIETAQTGSAAA